MANAELKVLLSGDAKQLSSTMKKASEDLGGFNSDLKKTQPALESLDKSINKTASNLSKIGKEAAKSAGDALKDLSNSLNKLDFSDKLSDVQNKLNASIDQMAASALKGGNAIDGLSNEAEQAVPQMTRLQSAVARFGGGVKTFSTANFELVSGVKLSGKELSKLPSSANRATESLVGLGRVVQDAPFGFIGIANNINPLLESFQRLKKETGSTKGALKSLASGLGGAGGIGLAVSVVTSLLVVFGDRLFKTSKAVEEAEDANKKYKESIDGIFQNAGKEASEVISLIAVLKNETETRERKLAAIKELQRIQPEVFNNLKLEGNAVSGLDAAYQSYLSNLRTVIAVKIKQAKLEQLITKQLQQQGATMTESERVMMNALDAFKQDQINQRIGGIGGEQTVFGKFLQKEQEAAKKEGAKLTSDIEGLFKQLVELSKGVDLKIDTKSPDKEADKFYNELIRKAKAFEKFINDRTIRFANFEVDPNETRAETIKRAQDFIQRAINDRGSFIIKTQKFAIELIPDELTIEPTQKYFEKQRHVAEKLMKDLQEEITKLTKRNPILIEFERVQAEQKARGAELAGSLGLSIEGVNAPTSLLTQMQKNAVNAANTINSILTPAFGSLFDEIRNGENPMKAFFKSIGQSIEQLIQKLIQAAIQAAIIQAFFPGLAGGGAGGFASIFQSLIGFKAEGGPVFSAKPYIVGEKGPELFIPSRSGQIIPNNQLNAGLATVTAGSLNVNITGRLRGRDMRLQNARQAGYEVRNV